MKATATVEASRTSEAFFQAPDRLIGDFCFKRTQMPVGVQGKQQAGNIHDEHEHGHKYAQLLNDAAADLRRGLKKNGRDDQGNDRQQQGRGAGPGQGLVKFLGLVFQPAGKNGHPQDQEQVADYRPGNGGLDQFAQPRPQGEQADDQFGGVAEGGVEDPSQGRRGVGRQGFGAVPHEFGQGDDGQGGKKKQQQRGKVQVFACQGGGSKDQEDKTNPVQHKPQQLLTKAASWPASFTLPDAGPRCHPPINFFRALLNHLNIHGISLLHQPRITPLIWFYGR